MIGTEYFVVSMPLGDIAPPPPEIPILEAALPHPMIVLIAGIGLSAAVVFAGIRWRKQGLSGRMLPTIILAVVLALGTFVVAALMTARVTGYLGDSFAAYRSTNFVSPR